MFDDQDIERASRELTAYRNDNALSRILDSYSTLLEDFQRLKSDYEEERNARERYKQIAKRQDRKPFVLVLVDGDGYIFHESLIKAGAEGGRRAAQMLDESVKFSLREKGLEHCDIMVRIYANIAGLSKALSKAGLGGHEARSLAPFVASFNRSYGLYDFVDAGDLKENADFKLRSTLRFYADIPSCRQIYFAACHDVGYISELTPHMSDKSRFTLVETAGVKFHDEFRKFNINVERFQGVFRSSPLDSSSSSTLSYSKMAVASPPAQTPREPSAHTYNPPHKSGSSTVCTFFLKGICKHGDKCQFAHPAGTEKTPQNWRERARQQTGSIEDLPAPSDIPENCIAVNAEGHRLDPLLPPGSIEASKALKARSRRICNEYHVLGSCRNGPGCEYDHTPLGPGMKGGAEALSRSILCARRGACRLVNCIKGHTCQVPGCSKRGGKEFCRLPTMAHTQSFVPADFVPGVITSSFRNGAQSPPSSDPDDDIESQIDGAAVLD
ncbi:hypothetical protein NLU13_0987 [Sarocladium strictum]|uniref:C3H1-type domain-containing protein n=1 Tax=Sarocladium strictum TaxID=5046 RepID=A0AA39LBB8_SARSR|nr:hypothetical protein NLU13_0987 [Sarocladium strictum]